MSVSVRAEGPSVETAAVGEDPSSVAVDRLSPGARSAPVTSRVHVEVRGVSAHETVAVDVSAESTDDDPAAFRSITTTVKRPGPITFEITTSEEALPGSPSFDTSPAARPLSHVRLDHSISNEDVADVSFTFRVSKARLRATSTDIESVVLYRYADGTWTGLPTEPVEETPTHYVFAVASPGMSEFVIGAERPEFDLWEVAVSDDSISVDQPVTVTARVTNVGEADGVFTATVTANGRVVERREVTIASGGTRQTTFRIAFERPGSHVVRVNGVTAGSVQVTAPGDVADAERDPPSRNPVRWVLGWLADGGRVALPGILPLLGWRWMA